MREIKYRAYIESVQKMLDWEYLQDKSDLGTVLKNGYGGYHVMQYTGLKDRSGNEIYEKDIITVDWDDKRYPPHNVEVKWNEEDLCWEIEGGCLTRDWIHFQVVGNVMENPELLNA